MVRFRKFHKIVGNCDSVFHLESSSNYAEYIVLVATSMIVEAFTGRENANSEIEFHKATTTLHLWT